MLKNIEMEGWVDVPKPGGWSLVLDEEDATHHHQLFQKDVDFELGADINRATLSVHFENDYRVSKIDFILRGDKGFVETAEFHFSRDGFLIAPLEFNPSLREEFKRKVGSLTADFFVLSGSLGTMGSLHLLNATRSLKTLVFQNPQPSNGHQLVA